MHAFTTEAMRPRHPMFGAARWNWRRRRIYFRLRFFGRALASVMTNARSGPLKALHDSRSLLAARVINEHRHLIQDYRCIGGLHCAGDAGVDAWYTELRER
jgi:hypothetical protein